MQDNIVAGFNVADIQIVLYVIPILYIYFINGNIFKLPQFG